MATTEAQSNGWFNWWRPSVAVQSPLPHQLPHQLPQQLAQPEYTWNQNEPPPPDVLQGYGLRAVGPSVAVQTPPFIEDDVEFYDASDVPTAYGLQEDQFFDVQPPELIEDKPAAYTQQLDPAAAVPPTAVPPTAVPPTAVPPTSIPVDLNALYGEKCATAYAPWVGSVFCGMGEGSSMSNIIGSMRLVPGKDGYVDNGMARVLVNMMQVAKYTVDSSNMLLRAVATRMRWYTTYSNQLEQLQVMVDEGYPILFSTLDPMAELFVWLMGYSLVRSRVEEFLRNNVNIAILDMNNNPPKQGETWGTWLLRLMGWRQ